jgi:hypothetical protein
MGRGPPFFQGDLSLGDTRIVLDSWVSLPRLGKDAFKDLMKTGVEYSTGKGFFIRSNADLRLVKAIVAAAAGGEVFFVFKCFICGDLSSCAECPYNAVCSVELVGGKCICSKCAREDLSAYCARWKSSLGGP